MASFSAYSVPSREANRIHRNDHQQEAPSRGLNMTQPKGKTYRVGISRRLIRAGLGPVFSKTTVGAHDSSPEALDALSRMLMNADPNKRLQAVKQRAKRHLGALGLANEIAEVEMRLAARNGNGEEVDTIALLAIERGLDLLDTGAFLSELNALRRADSGRAKGLIASAKSRAKLPSAATLILEIEKATQFEGGNRRAAVGSIARKYKVQTQAIGKRIKKASETT